MSMSKSSTFPDIKAYSKEIGLSEAVLREAFHLENHYHKLLIKEKKPKERERLYDEFYSNLLQFYGRTAKEDTSLESRIASKDPQVTLFEKELRGKSIIDFGCGEGFFLMNIHKNLTYKKLTGVDVFIPDNLRSHPKINFIASGIIHFRTEEKFEVAFSDNVIEHLAPLDLKDHLTSVYESLLPGGKFILVMPNRLFGPMDVTRILDNSSSGKTRAMGGHLNESTYHEMVEVLTRTGFGNFQTVLPIPKYKYSLFKNNRIKPNGIIAIEKSELLLKFFRAIKVKGRCPIRFTVTLICQKPE
ncbi:class I SAM-dependent methyltransferase [Pleomorphovibrio marinus]|uniref:class I SAM-dependent methyltransferase n=1 Tax=Pleomorphovibrio marinus TaxID=2164132 RepID=UPI000E0B4714|nr:methyltransferase domain-containing protein [Pleomorphovibrio marinus]